MASPPASRRPGVVTALLVLTVIGVVLWIYPAGRDTFEQPKWDVWMAGLGLTLGVGALLALRGRPLWLVTSPTALALMACLMWAELSASWAGSDVIPRRVLGLWWAMLLTVLLVQHAVWVSGRWLLMAMVGTAVGVVSAVAAMVLLQDFGLWTGNIVSRLEDWRGLLSGTLGNTTHLGDLFALGLTLALLLFLFARRVRALWTLGLACLLIAAAMTVCFSFHSDVSLIVGALILIVGVGQRRLWRRRRRLFVLGAVWAAMLAFYLTDVPGNPHHPGIIAQARQSERLAWGWGSRLAIWSNSLAMIGERPWFGWGVGCFSHGVTQQHSAWVADHPDPAIPRTAGRWTNAAHSVVLQTWAELGIVGLALWTVLLALHFQACARLMRRRRRRLRLAGLWLMALTVMWLLQGMMNFPLQMPVGRLTLALLLGAAAALEIKTRDDRDRWAIPLEVSLKGWRFAVAAAIAIALAAYPIHRAQLGHEVNRLGKAPYELSRIWVAYQRDPAVQAGAPPLLLAQAYERMEQWQIDSRFQPVDLWAMLEGFQAVLERDPGNRDARSGLHGSFVRLGLDLTSGARALPPDDPRREAWQRQGEAFLRASIVQGYEVLHVLQDADVFKFIAQAHEALGETDEARRLWQIHFERAPWAVGGPDFVRWMQDEEFRRRWAP